MTPQVWFCSVLDVLRASNPKLPFRVLSIESLESHPPQTTVWVLNQNDGSVWRFRCSFERGPA